MSGTRPSIATCTPVPFHANETFFLRDTGLICRELQKLGADCRVIMPLPAYEDDQPTPDLLRVEPGKLKSAAWWRSQGLDAVILYSWGDPRYTRIARAIRQAGIRLIIHFDSSGELHEHLSRPGNRLINRTKDFLVNILRRLHLSYADIITTSRPCVDSFSNDCYYGPGIAAKCRLFPAPVDGRFRYDGSAKQERIICAGSWQVPFKRAKVMMETLSVLLAQHPSVQADICGSNTPAIQTWHAALPEQQRNRVHLHGHCSHEQLHKLYNTASVVLCTSESEGSHTVSAEAMCCGCSVVCPPRPLLSVVRWYTSRNSGTVSGDDSPEQLASALLTELATWQHGERNAAEIAATWQPCFQVSQLAEWLS